MLAGIGAARDGLSHAQALRTLDQGGCRQLLATALHMSSYDVHTALRNPLYTGPLRVFEDQERWDQLGLFAAQSLSLSKCKGAAELYKLIIQHYTPLLSSNVWTEELVKM